MIAKRTPIRILLLSAAALLAGAVAGITALAQHQPDVMGQQSTPQQQQGQPTQPGQPANPGSEVPGMIPSAVPPIADQAFVISILESDAAEVQLGQLAQQKSQSDDVKQFGQKMVDDRKRLDDQLKPIAKELDVSEPKGPSKKDKESIAKLEALSGPQFDEQYIQVVVKDHRKDERKFKSESMSAQDLNVLHAARMDEPVIAQRLQAIEQIAQAHNIAISAKK